MDGNEGDEGFLSWGGSGGRVSGGVGAVHHGFLSVVWAPGVMAEDIVERLVIGGRCGLRLFATGAVTARQQLLLSAASKLVVTQLESFLKMRRGKSATQASED